MVKNILKLLKLKSWEENEKSIVLITKSLSKITKKMIKIIYNNNLWLGFNEYLSSIYPIKKNKNEKIKKIKISSLCVKKVKLFSPKYSI